MLKRLGVLRAGSGRKSRGWLTEEERVSGRRGGIIIQWEGEGVSVGAEYRLTVHYL